MTTFNKKNSKPNLYNILDMKLEEAIQLEKTYFYYGLKEEERDLGAAWALTKRLWFEISHKNGNLLVYKFSGIQRRK